MHRIARLLVGACLPIAGLAAVAALPGTAGAVTGVPGAPTALSAVSNTTTSVTLSWTAPTDTGTSAIKHYKVKTTTGAKTCVAPAPATTCTVTGLTSAHSYSFEVKAVNSAGSGPYSSTVRLEVGVPSAPTGVVASGGTTTGHPSAFVSFTAPASTGGSAIRGYYVTVADATTSTTVTKSAPVSAATSGFTVTSLNATDSYTFAVSAFNFTSVGPASTPTPAYPGAPTGVTATGNPDGTADISWTPSTVTLGNPATGFLVNSIVFQPPFTVGPSSTVGPTTTSTVLTGLTSGLLYDVCVNVEQALLPGASKTCTEFTEPSPTAPGVPTGVSVTAGQDGSGNPDANVTFGPPASDGGSAVTGYTVVVVDSTTSTTTDYAAPVSASAGGGYLVTGLNATDSYTFSVYATNLIGDGPASTPVVAYPASPTSVNVVSDGAGGATISWTPSDVTLGNPVTGYDVSTLDFGPPIGAGPTTTVDPSTTSTTLSGLNVGDLYDVCVFAQQGLSTGGASTCVYFTE